MGAPLSSTPYIYIYIFYSGHIPFSKIQWLPSSSSQKTPQWISSTSQQRKPQQSPTCQWPDIPWQKMRDIWPPSDMKNSQSNWIHTFHKEVSPLGNWINQKPCKKTSTTNTQKSIILAETGGCVFFCFEQIASSLFESMKREPWVRSAVWPVRFFWGNHQL